MTNDGSREEETQNIGAVAKIANSKAAEKLAEAVKGLVQLPHNALDYLVGPKRITAVNDARAEGAIVEARAQAEIERIRAETAEFVLDREMRKTLNRRAIVEEAQKALPPPNAIVSDQTVSKDFVHAFFEEFDGISDPEVHKIVGRLLAGEVVRPGSFPRRTMRVLRDLESTDFDVFTTLCRFAWNTGQVEPLIFDPNDPIYLKHGLNFVKISELDALGLVTFGSLGVARTGLPAEFNVSYGSVVIRVEMKKGTDKLNIGQVMFTEAGRRLGPLTNATMVPDAPEFVEYVLGKWQSEGHKANLLKKGIEEAAPTARDAASKAA